MTKTKIMKNMLVEISMHVTSYKITSTINCTYRGAGGEILTWAKQKTCLKLSAIS